jgi:hypothetical protein
MYPTDEPATADDENPFGNPPPFETLDYPVRSVAFGEPVPDLRRIPEARWREVLPPLRSESRRYAINSAPQDRTRDALELVGLLEFEEPGRRWGVAAKPEEVQTRIPVPGTHTSEGTRGRQVNVRLRPDDHARLERAAELLALTPTQLARTFIVNGVSRVLTEPR